MLQHLVASVNSASTSCPFGNNPWAPQANNGYAADNSSTSGAKARAVTISTNSGGLSTKSPMRTGWMTAEAPATLAASRRNAAFLMLLSTKCTRAPGESASAQASTKPGKPAPEPKSTQIFACGASARSWSKSAICRVQSFGTVDGAIRFIFGCQTRSVATNRSSRAIVSRETGVSASALLRSSVRSGDCAIGRFVFRLPALPAHMHDQQR